MKDIITGKKLPELWNRKKFSKYELDEFMVGEDE